MASYAAASDLLARFDNTVVAELCADDHQEVPSEDLATNTNLLAALADASGDVESAMLIGERYTTAQLEALTGNSLGKLKRITCTIAMAYLMERRPLVHVSNAERLLKRAEEYLEQLRTGQRIFNVTDNVVDYQLPTINGPTSVKYEEMNLVTERMGVRYFPEQLTRLPTTRG
jgi:phage gp36-like protein